MSPEAVVFDFDGLILDTEWVIYEAALSAFRADDHELSVEAWATIVGLNDDAIDDWWDRLCSAAEVTGFDRALFDASYAAHDRSSRDELLPLPGVLDLVEELHRNGVPAGIASSSSSGWLERHLGRLGIRDRFGAVVGADVVGGVGKPEPDVYFHVCDVLGADPRRSVAIEDSAHGVTAAKAAGMVAVAVPSRITRYNDFGHADLVVGSVGELDLRRLAALV